MMENPPITFVEEVYRINAELREIGLRKIRPKGKFNKPVGFWIEDEPMYVNGQVKLFKSLVIIFGTKGCRWAWMGRGGGCIYCGYVYKNPREGGDLIKQLEYIFSKTAKKRNEIELVKIFTSGSYLDNYEVSPDLRIDILNMLKDYYKNLRIIQLETRPEHVLNREILNQLKEVDLEIYFNIGLETANEVYLGLINKGFTFKIFEKALKRAHENGFKVKTYLMLKQPFQTELEAINDVISSGKKVIDLGTDMLSINPMVIYSYTFVEKIWHYGLYRPPWLNSVIYVVRELIKYGKGKGIPVICDPVAPSSERGPRSCDKKCDKELIKTLREIVLNQDPNIDIPTCCEGVWKKFLEEENVKRDLAYSSIF